MWREQWDRMLRYRERVRVATQTYTTGGSTDDRRDDVLAFFQNCYHLKDWLKNDPATRLLVKGGVEQLIKNSDELKIVADLTNGAKHLDLSAGPFPPKTGDPSTALTRTDVNILIGAGGRHTFYVSSKGKQYEALSLADEALRQWTKYLNDRGLL